jgi:hypothetical protein
MVVAGSIVDTFATGTGLLAGAIAVGGFISHVGPALAGSSEKKVRKATVLGGLAGFGFGSLVIVLSAYIR